jgi:hypothetical protein
MNIEEGSGIFQRENSGSLRARTRRVAAIFNVTFR